MATAHDSPTVPRPLEQYAHAFDDLFQTSIQCRRFRDYLAGLLLPRDRNKTLTALVGAEPITQAQTAPVRQLQFFLTEADGDAETVTARRIELLRDDPRPRRTMMVRWSSTRRGYARMGRTRPTSGTSTWAPSARSPTASSPSPVCGPTSACTPRCTCAPTRPPRGWRGASSIRPCAPSRSWPAHWWRRPAPLASPCAR